MLRVRMLLAPVKQLVPAEVHAIRIAKYVPACVSYALLTLHEHRESKGKRPFILDVREPHELEKVSAGVCVAVQAELVIVVPKWFV